MSQRNIVLMATVFAVLAVLVTPQSPSLRKSGAAFVLSDLLIDPSLVSASGISSGADFVVQLQVAYSSLFKGIGVFAGQSYHCAVHRFPEDAIVAANSTKDAKNIPYCDGCPPGDTLAVYDHCKVNPVDTADPSPLIAYAKAQSAAGNIDDIGNLTAPDASRGSKRIYLYRGAEDSTYRRGSVNATANFFRNLLPDGGRTDLFFETRVNSSHLLPGIDPYLCWWEEWDGPDNCTYDGAHAVLEWIYGPDALLGGRSNDTESLIKQLRNFSQQPFFPGDGRDPLMADEAFAFVPPNCVSSTAQGDTTSHELDRRDGGPTLCKLHLFFHGCGVEPTYPVFSKYGGFLEWAVRCSFFFLLVVLCRAGVGCNSMQPPALDLTWHVHSWRLTGQQ